MVVFTRLVIMIEVYPVTTFIAVVTYDICSASELTSYVKPEISWHVLGTSNFCDIIYVVNSKQ